MKKAFLWTILCMLLVLAALMGCRKAQTGAGEVSVAQAQAWLSAGEATAVDINVEEVRAEYGLLPGALLLETASGYAAAVLPGDKARKLVFYCLNRLCTASHTAAARAKGFGYPNVYVMSEGIKAWQEAGFALEPPR